MMTLPPPDTLPALIASLSAAGYTLQPHLLSFRTWRGGGKVYLVDIIEFCKKETVIPVLVLASGATVAEALETARVKIID